jgi:hypothetical protein
MDSHLAQLKLALESAIEGMSIEQLCWHPEGKWCAAEVLEHLYLTYTGTIKGFENALAVGEPLVAGVSLKQRWQTIVVVGFGYMPGGRKAPRRTEPRGMPADTVRNELGAAIVAMDAAITRCEHRFGRGVRLVVHPVLGPLTASQWRKFHLVHGLHHEKQLLRLRQGSL